MFLLFKMIWDPGIWDPVYVTICTMEACNKVLLCKVSSTHHSPQNEPTSKHIILTLIQYYLILVGKYQGSSISAHNPCISDRLLDWIKEVSKIPALMIPTYHRLEFFNLVKHIAKDRLHYLENVLFTAANLCDKMAAIHNETMTHFLDSERDKKHYLHTKKILPDPGSVHMPRESLILLQMPGYKLRVGRRPYQSRTSTCNFQTLSEFQWCTKTWQLSIFLISNKSWRLFDQIQRCNTTGLCWIQPLHW